jgi:uncharacterized protein YndB with AHSA1/START domain
MSPNKKTWVLVEACIKAPVNYVWKCWTTPEDIMEWNSASDDWHTPSAENDLWAGGRFSYRMEAKDGSIGFDFWGTYQVVVPRKRIEVILGDERLLHVWFSGCEGETLVCELFQTESVNPVEMQRLGWQSILNRFKNYVEATSQSNKALDNALHMV